MTGPIMKLVDGDKDGKITKEEWNKSTDSLFAKFDAKKEGKLDEEAFTELLNELIPPPQGWGAPPPKKPETAGKSEKKAAPSSSDKK
jgi:hypothetical protein